MIIYFVNPKFFQIRILKYDIPAFTIPPVTTLYKPEGKLQLHSTRDKFGHFVI